MKYLTALLFALVLLSACSFTPVLPQAEWEAYATARAMPVPPIPTIEPQVAPPTATVELVPTVTPEPIACDPVIKGNINAAGEKIAHSPGQANYDNVIISLEKGEKLFCTLADAEAEGWRAAQR